MIFAIYSLYQFSKQTIDWTKELSRCKAIMWGAFQNLGSALDTWADLEEFDDLLQKTARMFVCVPPKKLRELQLVDILFLLIIRIMHHYCERRKRAETRRNSRFSKQDKTADFKTVQNRRLVKIKIADFVNA